jgi:N-acetylneuraminic acid mutarotase
LQRDRAHGNVPKVIQLATWALAALAASWMTGSPLPEPRSEVAAAPLLGRIVVVGGFLESGANSRRVDAYDPARDTWTRLPDLPVSVDHAAAASVRGRLVVVGGYGADRQPLRAAFLFDGSRWRALPAPPEERAAAAATATAGGTVWVVGGRTRDGLATTMLALDVTTFRWRVVRGPRPREHLAATALGGKVYAIGGRLAGYDTNFATVEAYDPRANRWRRMPDLPSARGGTGAAAVAGRIVSVGGESPQGTERTVWALRPSAKRWVRLPDLPTPRHGLGVVSLGRRVWVVAGGPEPGLTVSGAVESLPLAPR